MEEIIKRPRIKITPKAVSQIKEEFNNCSATTLYQALAFFCNNENSRSMRRRAIELGGRIIYEEFIV